MLDGIVPVPDGEQGVRRQLFLQRGIIVAERLIVWCGEEGLYASYIGLLQIQAAVPDLRPFALDLITKGINAGGIDQ